MIGGHPSASPLFVKVRHCSYAQVEILTFLPTGVVQGRPRHIKHAIGFVIGLDPWRKLSAVAVEKMKAPGIYPDGGGLCLQVAAGKKGVGKSWILR
jgi:hypothetical protein